MSQLIIVMIIIAIIIVIVVVVSNNNNKINNNQEATGLDTGAAEVPANLFSNDQFILGILCTVWMIDNTERRSRIVNRFAEAKSC